MKRLDVIQRWHHGVRTLHKAHFESARMYEHRNLMIGVPIVMLSTIAGTTVFATMETSPQIGIKVFVGLLSLCAAVLGGLQTFLRYSERAERHKIAGVKYGVLRREIEQAMAIQPASEILTDEFCESFRARWDQLDEESPIVPQSIYERTATEISREIDRMIKITGKEHGMP